MSSKEVSPDDLVSEPAKRSIKISKSVAIIIIISVIALFVAVIIGLAVGLKSAYETDCTKISENEKYETCRELSCKNSSILQGRLPKLSLISLKFSSN